MSVEPQPTAEEELYRSEVGEPHNLPDDDPDRWQWSYTGSREDRKQLWRVGAGYDNPADVPGQETLF